MAGKLQFLSAAIRHKYIFFILFCHSFDFVDVWERKNSQSSQQGMHGWSRLDEWGVVIGYGHTLYDQIEVIVVSVFVHSSKDAGAIALVLGGFNFLASQSLCCI